MTANWAMFLDRDGVIVEEVNYLDHLSQLRLIPRAAQAIRCLNERSIPVIVVTNQAGVARGYYPESRVAQIHAALNDMLQPQQARIDRFYYCPHHPAAGQMPYRVACECRKPNPGMLLRAASDCKLDLSSCWLVGDKVSDLQAGQRAGCHNILVLTGYGATVWQRWRLDCQPDHVATDLFEAVQYALDRSDPERAAHQVS